MDQQHLCCVLNPLNLSFCVLHRLNTISLGIIIFNVLFYYDLFNYITDSTHLF